MVLAAEPRLSRMAAEYRTSGAPVGIAFHGCSGTVGSVVFRRGLTFIVAKPGLYVAPGPVFRLALGPLLIPWADVTSVAERRYLLYRRGAYFLQGAAASDLVVPANVLDAARAHLSCEVVQINWSPLSRLTIWLERTRRGLAS
jgi:hypothetical protein